MQSWEDPIADARITTSASAPAVFTEPEVVQTKTPMPAVQASDSHTFEEVISKPSDTAIVEATEALKKLRAEDKLNPKYRNNLKKLQKPKMVALPV